VVAKDGLSWELETCLKRETARKRTIMRSQAATWTIARMISENQLQAWRRATAFLQHELATAGKFPWTATMANAKGVRSSDLDGVQTFQELARELASKKVSFLRETCAKLNLTRSFPKKNPPKKIMIQAIVTKYREMVIDPEIGDFGWDPPAHADLQSLADLPLQKSAEQMLTENICIAHPVIQELKVRRMVQEVLDKLITEGKVSARTAAFHISKKGLHHLHMTLEIFIAVMWCDAVTWADIVLRLSTKRCPPCKLRITHLAMRLSDVKNIQSKKLLITLLHWLDVRDDEFDPYSGEAPASTLCKGVQEISRAALRRLLDLAVDPGQVQVDAKLYHSLKCSVDVFLCKAMLKAVQRAVKKGRRRLLKSDFPRWLVQRDAPRPEQEEVV